MSGKKSDDGVSEIIAFMLIFALIVAFLGAWVIYYVPTEGHTAEVQHDEEVLRQFSDIKTGIDLLWMTDKKTTIQRLVSLAPTKATDLSTLLFLTPSLGSGNLKIEEGTTCTFYDKKYNSETKMWEKDTQYDVSMLRLTYTSYNQYSDDFTIVYDGGAVFYGDLGSYQYLLESPIVSGDTICFINVTASVKETTKLGNHITKVKIKYNGSKTTAPIEIYNNEFYDIDSDYADYWDSVLNTGNINYVVIKNYDLYFVEGG